MVNNNITFGNAIIEAGKILVQKGCDIIADASCKDNDATAIQINLETMEMFFVKTAKKGEGLTAKKDEGLTV